MEGAAVDLTVANVGEDPVLAVVVVAAWLVAVEVAASAAVAVVVASVMKPKARSDAGTVKESSNEVPAYPHPSADLTQAATELPWILQPSEKVLLIMSDSDGSFKGIRLTLCPPDHVSTSQPSKDR